jgi:hypothetical protein
MAKLSALLMLCLALVVFADEDYCTTEARKEGLPLGHGPKGEACFAKWSEEKEGLRLELCSGTNYEFLYTLTCKDLKGWCSYVNDRGVRWTAEFRRPDRVLIHATTQWAAPWDGSGLASFRSSSMVIYRKDGRVTGWNVRRISIDGGTKASRCRIETSEE